MTRRAEAFRLRDGWVVILDEPCWFTRGAVACHYAGRAVRWVVMLAVPAVAIIWMVVEALAAATLGVVVFVGVPAVVIGLRLLTAAWNDAGGLGGGDSYGYDPGRGYGYGYGPRGWR